MAKKPAMMNDGDADDDKPAQKFPAAFSKGGGKPPLATKGPPIGAAPKGGKPSFMKKAGRGK